MTYKEMIAVVQQFQVQAGESIRVNCPACGGRKTLSLTKKDGQLFWNCFKASCDLTGTNTVGRTNKEIQQYLSGKREQARTRTPDVPPILSAPSNCPNVMLYLKDNNCLQAYEDKAIKIAFSPRDQRVLFFTPNQKGCVGRSLVAGTKPKWKAYGEFDCLFSVGKASTCVVVEDAASACAVASTGVYTGVALLGTHMSLKQREWIANRYSSCLICLDKDASKKAVSLSKKLRGRIQVQVKLLTRDLKQYQPEEILEILK